MLSLVNSGGYQGGYGLQNKVVSAGNQQSVAQARAGHYFSLCLASSRMRFAREGL
jgi:hypothetical protein